MTEWEHDWTNKIALYAPKDFELQHPCDVRYAVKHCYNETGQNEIMNIKKYVKLLLEILVDIYSVISAYNEVMDTTK